MPSAWHIWPILLHEFYVSHGIIFTPLYIVGKISKAESGNSLFAIRVKSGVNM